MARIVHIALKVDNLEDATRFYEGAFDMHQVGTGYARGHTSRHMSDGALDMALMVYDNEEVHEAQLSGAGPCIHHWGIEVEDRDAAIKAIEQNGGVIISDPDEGALKFRAPDGTVAEITRLGRYKRHVPSDKCRVVRLAIQVGDLDSAARFYETVFGFKTVSGGDPDTRHLTDGAFDIVLMKGQGGASASAKHHHIGVKVFDRDGFVDGLARNGAAILPHESGGILFRAPDGTLAEIVTPMG
jgi:lactoylglutathione lyase